MPAARVWDEVSALLRRLGSDVVMPRFRALAAAEIEEKAPGDLVTVVDRQVEAELDALTALIPGSRIVGEEAASVRSETLEGLDRGWVWIVDPLDGTRNFVEGRPHFAIMVALLRDGDTVASWIYWPTEGKLYAAEAGGGATIDGRPLVVEERSTGGEGAHRGLASTRYLPPELESAWDRGAASDEIAVGSGSSGISYPELIEGRWRFLFYWRTRPWDHAPGGLLVREAGGHVARLDGTPYLAGDERAGLLVAPSREEWRRVSESLPIRWMTP